MTGVEFLHPGFADLLHLNGKIARFALCYNDLAQNHRDQKSNHAPVLANRQGHGENSLKLQL
jgi:hypothetical protein